MQPSPPDPATTDSSLLRHVRQGSPDAADVLYKRYSGRIRALARSKLSRGLSRRLDEEDIVQSVFRRFFQAAKSGRYALPTGDELWDLLVVITLNRLRTEEQFHRAGKRDVRRTVGWDAAGVADPGGRRDEGLEGFFVLAVKDALQRLPPHYQEVVRLRLDGHEVADIATATGRSKRTVERVLNESRAVLQSLLDVEP